MKIALQPAFLLHGRSYRDSSVLVEMFTRDYGRMGCIARGARQSKHRFFGLLQPFRSLLISWSGRGELPTLTDCDEPEKMPPLTGNRLLSGIYINELLYRLLPRYDSHEGLFQDYRDCLQALGGPGSLAAVLRIFEKRLLAEMGYGLQLWQEADSHALLESDCRYFYSLSQGPRKLECEQLPPGGVVINGRTLLDLQQERFTSKQSLQEARQLTRMAIQEHLNGRPLNTPALLRK